MISKTAKKNTDAGPLWRWLLLCAAMVFTMAVIGAVTRLTESGLSITRWDVVMGALPPLSEQAWQEQFDLYRQTPEFAHKHYWMELSDFKQIFFWEWLHRLWGRLIGLAFALPLLVFALRKAIPRGYGWKLAGMLVLGGSQGALGWYMVQSGLIDRPSVSHFRLAAHLALALLIFSLLLWLALDLRGGVPRFLRPARPLPRPAALTALALVGVTIVWGAFVAGLDAGMVYNEFPLMGGRPWPPEPFHGVASLLNDIPWVQFTHRVLALSTAALLITLAIRYNLKPLGIMAGLQVMLGIGTLLMQVPVAMGALHQAGAIIVLGLTICALHSACPQNLQDYGKK